MLSISGSYIQTRRSLQEKIRNGTISILESIAKNHACYLCLMKIDGKMFVLIEQETLNGKIHDSFYTLDSNCFMQTKRSTELEGKYFSIN